MDERKETMDDYKAELEASFRKLSEGDIVTATVIAVSEDEASLDLKYFAPGIIKAKDLSDDPDYSIMENLHPGDELQASILSMDDGSGNILLSKKEANQTLGWEKVKEAMENQTILNVQKKKLVLTAKGILKEREEEARNHRISMLAPGTVVEGVVESLTNYGAFVNIGDGLTGMVHVSQVCQRRISKPGEVLKIGQKVRAKLLNTKDNRIALSIRALEETAEPTTESSKIAKEYSSHESASTSLGDLIAKLNLK